MKPEVFIKAARRIKSTGGAACDAVKYTLNNNYTEFLKYESFFSNLFEPKKKYGVAQLFWWEYPFTEKSQLERSLALLLAAEILKDEKKS